MKKLKVKLVHETNTDLKDMSEENKKHLNRILNVFLDFVEILSRRKIKEQITGSDEDFEMILATNKILGDENDILKKKIKQLEEYEYDEKNNRFYEYAKKSDNPKRAICPKCKKEEMENEEDEFPNDDHLLRPLIHSVYGDKKYHGVYCWFHGEVWFDKENL